jgi:hypothetical protein
MGFFKRDAGGVPRGLTACPVCDELLTKNQGMDHYATHIFQLDSGPYAGAYTWTCSCGPANMGWPNEDGAWAGLALHLQQVHGIQTIG